MNSHKVEIIAVDDDEKFLFSVEKFLSLKGYRVDTLTNPSLLLNSLEQKKYSSILLDVNMPGIQGLNLFNEVIDKHPLIPVVMISGDSTIGIAVEAIKNGAYDFIEKPLDPDRLFITLQNAINKKQLLEEKENLENILDEKIKIVAESSSMKNILKQIAELSATSVRVLITGGSGTGKELIAYALHKNSPRKNKPYIKLNCASIPRELLESELFGHKKGSFTGALTDREGKFIAADGGTLFLDEIGDMSIELQAKLLRVLEEGEAEIIGENFPRKVDVRIIAATNKNLEELIAENKFRIDLFHRLNVMRIHIPALKERVEDIIPLMNYFLHKYNESYNKQITSISAQAESILKKYDWPGNVRELRNVAEILVIYSKGNRVEINDVINLLGANGKNDKAFQIDDDLKLKEAKQDFERNYIIQALQKHHWKISETAAELGIDRTNLFKKMQALGIKK